MRAGYAAFPACWTARAGRKQLADGDIRKNHGVDLLYQIINRIPEAREPFWKTFVEVGKKNPGALRQIVTLMAIYLHLGPFSKHVIAEIDRRIAELDARSCRRCSSGGLPRAGRRDRVTRNHLPPPSFRFID